MKKVQAHIYAKITVQVNEGDSDKIKIRESFDNRLLAMTPSSPLPFMLPAKIGVEILAGKVTHVIEESEIFGTEKEYKFVTLTTREGEREFDWSFTMEVDPGMSEDEIYEKAVTERQGGGFDEINNKGEFEFDGGEYVVYGCSVKPMTKFEFEIVKKFT